MDRLDYAQGVVIARVNEKKLLDSMKIDRLIDAKDADEAFRILMETDYANTADGVEGAKDYEKLLKNQMTKLYETGREMLFDMRILEILSLEYDYHNIKTIVKAKVSGKDLSDLFVYTGSTNPVKLQSQFESGNYTGTKSEFIKALRLAKEAYEDTKDPQMIDITVDKEYFAHLAAIAEDINIDLFEDYIRATIDFYNITTLLRAVKMGKKQQFIENALVEGGGISTSKLLMNSREDFERLALILKSEKIGRALMDAVEDYRDTGSLTVLNRAKDNYLKRLNSDSKFIAFGPEPIFAYLVAKQKEIAIVRLIMVGKMNRISPDKLRERLGDMNV